MQEIRMAIAKSFGFVLSDEEVLDIINWYKTKKNFTVDEFRTELTRYLYTKHKGKMHHLFEEDTSNLQYLLSLLDKKIKGR